jgi:hypothetical protein
VLGSIERDSRRHLLEITRSEEERARHDEPGEGVVDPCDPGVVGKLSVLEGLLAEVEDVVRLLAPREEVERHLYQLVIDPLALLDDPRLHPEGLAGRRLEDHPAVLLERGDLEQQILAFVLALQDEPVTGLEAEERIAAAVRELALLQTELGGELFLRLPRDPRGDGHEAHHGEQDGRILEHVRTSWSYFDHRPHKALSVGGKVRPGSFAVAAGGRRFPSGYGLLGPWVHGHQPSDGMAAGTAGPARPSCGWPLSRR